MSEYYDHYHRWEPLAEFHFNFSDEDELDDENFLYCLCSRAYIRDGVKTYYVDKGDGSESDMEVIRDSQSQECEDQSHVHFSLDTSYKVKCEKDEGASCYCSASHTDNCCSTDEHDAQVHGPSHALQPSDSGADLTYQDCHSEYTNPDKLERMDQDLPNPPEENYLSEDTWDKFWAINGERLIWASWIKKYSDYINPAYLDENNDLMLDDNSIPKQKSVDQIYRESDQKNDDNEIRERKFSYDSKVNPYKKGHGQNQTEKLDRSENKDGTWLGRRRSCSEHERIVSPRTLAATDSMTNVTKITLSSYDITSSHVTSESTPTDDYSVSSATSDDQSNDQTRIANVENADPISIDDMDTDQYWQFLWKKHFGEQYALHYAYYIETHNAQDKEVPTIKVETTTPEDNEKDMPEVPDTQEKSLEIECENSEGNSQELPTVIEVQAKVSDMKLEEPVPKPRKREKKKSNKYFNSVGLLLQNLLKDEQNNDGGKTEVTEAGDSKTDKKEAEMVTDNSVQHSSTNLQQSGSNTNFTSYSYDGGDDDPPEETRINLKRSHEIDYEEETSEKIKSTFEIMGFSLKHNNIPKGQMVFRKRLSRLRPPRYKRFGASKKTYFDEDGNPIQVDQNKEYQEEREMQTDDEVCPDFKSEARRILDELAKHDSEKHQTDEELYKIENAKCENVIDVKDTKHLTLSQNVNQKVAEDMNVDVNDSLVIKNKISNVNKSTKSDVIEEHKDKSEKINIHNKQDNMNIDIKQVDDLEDNSKEIDIVAENDSAIDISEKSREFDNYDVQNNVNDFMDENNALEAADVPLPDDFGQSGDETKPEPVENLVTQNVDPPKRRRRQKRYAKVDEEDLSNVPEELRNDPKMMKYWKKRHSLFHRFDEGIRLDRESWFSVTPESVARHIARKDTYSTVLDAFCGAGGNAIQFAFTSKKVIAIDIDPVKVEMARHNATVYGVADRIQFIVGDFFELAPSLEADMVFLSPPWGGPDYSDNAEYDIETMLEPKPASELMCVARTISPTISLYLPRNTKADQILSLAKEVGGSVEVEQSYLDKRFVAITAYFY